MRKSSKKGLQASKTSLERASLWKGCANLFFFVAFHRWSGSDYLSVNQTKAILWGRLLWMTVITKARKSKSEEWFHCGVRIGFFSATWAVVLITLMCSICKNSSFLFLNGYLWLLIFLRFATMQAAGSHFLVMLNSGRLVQNIWNSLWEVKDNTWLGDGEIL